ncbi:mandelate racemase/muconate lactonizing enzyme family protein [Naasia sp. SYSU D00057]|uniref:mandelate racemase/muconate lactonizing enzyme family protein n=1 Tax=Naasia sp. SYSU D00057 TaxID=2817380 RepID=UPI001B300D66|nr:mandelate racemase/muconate lactonizing enzyme family protein [Naasia sp. SYSU D00057]
MNTALTVTGLRAVLLSHRYPKGEELTWVGGTIRSWDAALVEVTLSDGTRGIGEAGAGIMAALAVPGIVDSFRPYLEGRGFGHPLEVADHLRAYTAFWSRGGILNGVAGAIETAALDAVAKREGVPAYELLGGLARPTIEAYASGGLGTTFDEVSAWADAQIAAGFGTVKFRAMTDPDTTVRLLVHVAGRLPDGVRFVIDAVQACASDPWPVDEAIRVGRKAAELGARWYEEPCQADDVAGYARVRSEVDVPISGVESNGTVREFAELIAAGGVDIAQPDVTFVGGPAAFARVSGIAREAGVAVVPHVWGSGVTFSANLHTVLADPHVELFEYCTLSNPLRDALLVEPVGFRDGRVVAPTAPGLGVRLTPEIERDFPFHPGGGHVIR